jgi:hypothetical protein
MSLWHFHEAYKALDVQSVYWYPNKCPMKQLIHVPKFDGDPSSVVAHVVEFVEFIIHYNIEQEDVIVWLFLLSLEERKRDWIRHSCSPKSISSSIILIRDFLKHWGPRNQKLEDTIQDLEDILWGCSFLSDLIEGLKETLLLKSDESTIEEEEIEDDSNEENFECFKENIQEDNELCEQLLEHCHNKDFLVKFLCAKKRRIQCYPSKL